MNQQTAAQREFNALVEPNLKSLKNTAYRLTRNEIESEDLLQETFLKAFRAFGSYQRNTNFRAWVFKILINTYISAYRKMVRRPQKVSYEDLEDYQLYQKSLNEENTAFSVESEYEDYFVDEVKSAIEKLPYYFRLVLLLSDIEGFSYHEISEILNIPIGTVMSRLHRSRSLLRKKLRRYASEFGYVTA